LEAPFQENYIPLVLALENHEFSKKEKEFLDERCNYYKFSKWKFRRPLKPSHNLS